MRPTAILPLVLVVLSTIAHAQVVPERHDEIHVMPQASALSLSWSDTDDDLKGSVTPIQPREGSELTVSLRIAPFYGEPFDGPVTLALRSKDGTHREEHTVTQKERAWTARFTPRTGGPHVLAVTFRTTRVKVLHAEIPVEDLPVPRFIAWALLGALTLSVVGFTAWRLLRRPAQREP